MEKRARGNILVPTRRFVDTELDPSQREAVYAALSPATRDAIPSIGRGDWCTRDYVSELWAAIASTEDDPVAARALLERCGRFIGHDATNTFLRLLVRLLTPAVFAKKFPKIWKKDFDFGVVETRVGDRELVIEVRDVEGFNYFAFTAVGWFSHTMTMMGCKGVIAEHNGTFDEPGPKVVSCTLKWD